MPAGIDFLRDSRGGDTIHPSTLEIIHELGLLDDFLDFLAQHGRAYPTFTLRMETEVTELVQEGGRVVGVRAQTPRGALEVWSDLVVRGDGRGSTVRQLAGLASVPST